MSKEKVSEAVKKSLSPARMATYEQAFSKSPLLLYAWNAKVSGALMLPLNVCEVTLRNAVSSAIESVYGPHWPWSPAFERSLQNPSYGYSPRIDLTSTIGRFNTTGKVIPELKFVFWQKMFTSRFDSRIWNSNLFNIFLNPDKTRSVQQLRESFYSDLEKVRLLRNRIAHHEPIFSRNLTEEYDRIYNIINCICPTTASWMVAEQVFSYTETQNPMRN